MLRIPNSGDFAQGTENWKQMRSCFVTASYAAEVVRIRKDRKIRVRTFPDINIRICGNI